MSMFREGCMGSSMTLVAADIIEGAGGTDALLRCCQAFLRGNRHSAETCHCGSPVKGDDDDRLGVRAITMQQPFAAAMVHGMGLFTKRGRTTTFAKDGEWVAVHCGSKDEHLKKPKLMANIRTIWPGCPPDDVLRAQQKSIIGMARFVDGSLSSRAAASDPVLKNYTCSKACAWRADQAIAFSSVPYPKGFLQVWHVKKSGFTSANDLHLMAARAVQANISANLSDAKWDVKHESEANLSDAKWDVKHESEKSTDGACFAESRAEVEEMLAKPEGVQQLGRNAASWAAFSKKKKKKHKVKVENLDAETSEGMVRSSARLKQRVKPHRIAPNRETTNGRGEKRKARTDEPGGQKKRKR